MIKYLVPMIIFVMLTGLFLSGLHKGDPTVVPSPLIGKPVPAFVLPRLDDVQANLTDQDLKGKVVLLNVWGSYCIPCRQEHPLFMELAKQKVVAIYGLNYADVRTDALDWLKQLGNPFVMSAFDEERRVSIDFGVYGVPETYVIDKDGIIRYKKVGVISEELLAETILPLIEELKKQM
ncbi:MAG: thiol:disulfide interchange protein [Gammaproteobacteria bacterium]|nr:thiol:disulfide interchange protein [Gammaproteobacteria bacterium]